VSLILPQRDMSDSAFNATNERLQRVQGHKTAAEIVFSPHPLWPAPPSVSIPARELSCLKIAVLDSSFNPPTCAHSALATLPHSVSGTQGNYDALILLLSVRNADKSLKPGDATYLQRLEMMTALAQELTYREKENVAVIIVDEPTFAGKANILRPFLINTIRTVFEARQSPIETIKIELTFLMGMDTLERLFAPRYYGSEQAMTAALERFLASDAEGCWIICARRSMTDVNVAEQERKALGEARRFIDSGKVIVADIGERESAMSSSEVRRSVAVDNSAALRNVPTVVAEVMRKHRLYQTLV
jgi:nicotinamide-nucleotide adenylyltransferase